MLIHLILSIVLQDPQNCFQSLTLRPVVSASPGNFLEMHILRPQSIPMESEHWERGGKRSLMSFNKSPGDSHAHSDWRAVSSLHYFDITDKARDAHGSSVNASGYMVSVQWG